MAKECRSVTRHHGNQYANKENYSETSLSFDACQNAGICGEYPFYQAFYKTAKELQSVHKEVRQRIIQGEIASTMFYAGGGRRELSVEENASADRRKIELCDLMIGE